MHDLAIAAAFILIVISPCLVAARSGYNMELSPEDRHRGDSSVVKAIR